MLYQHCLTGLDKRKFQVIKLVICRTGDMEGNINITICNVESVLPLSKLESMSTDNRTNISLISAHSVKSASGQVVHIAANKRITQAECRDASPSQG